MMDSPEILKPFNNYIDAKGQIWIIDQLPDSNNQVEPVGRWNGRASNSLGEGEARRYRPGIDPPMTFLTPWDYQTGVDACIRNPERYRVDGMSDADYNTLLAYAAKRRPALDAQDREIQRGRGVA